MLTICHLYIISFILSKSRRQILLLAILFEVVKVRVREDTTASWLLGWKVGSVQDSPSAEHALDPSPILFLPFVKKSFQTLSKRNILSTNA